MVDTYDFLDNIGEVREFTKKLRETYINYISEFLMEYVKGLDKEMRKTALILVKKCKEVQFPLEVFRHGTDYVINQNRQWSGYEFKIDKNGKFYVKDQVNNKQRETRENGHSYNITPFVETDIMEFDFTKVNNDYLKVVLTMEHF